MFEHRPDQIIANQLYIPKTGDLLSLNIPIKIYKILHKGRSNANGIFLCFCPINLHYSTTATFPI